MKGWFSSLWIFDPCYLLEGLDFYAIGYICQHFLQKQKQKQQNEGILKGDLVEWLIGCDLATPIMIVSQQTDQEPGS